MQIPRDKSPLRNPYRQLLVQILMTYNRNPIIKLVFVNSYPFK